MNDDGTFKPFYLWFCDDCSHTHLLNSTSTFSSSSSSSSLNQGDNPFNQTNEPKSPFNFTLLPTHLQSKICKLSEVACFTINHASPTDIVLCGKRKRPTTKRSRRKKSDERQLPIMLPNASKPQMLGELVQEGDQITSLCEFENCWVSGKEELDDLKNTFPKFKQHEREDESIFKKSMENKMEDYLLKKRNASSGYTMQVGAIERLDELIGIIKTYSFKEIWKREHFPSTSSSLYNPLEETIDNQIELIRSKEEGKFEEEEEYDEEDSFLQEDSSSQDTFSSSTSSIDTPPKNLGQNKRLRSSSSKNKNKDNDDEIDEDDRFSVVSEPLDQDSSSDEEFEIVEEEKEFDFDNMNEEEEVVIIDRPLTTAPQSSTHFVKSKRKSKVSRTMQDILKEKNRQKEFNMKALVDAQNDQKRKQLASSMGENEIQILEEEEEEDDEDEMKYLELIKASKNKKKKQQNIQEVVGGKGGTIQRSSSNQQTSSSSSSQFVPARGPILDSFIPLYGKPHPDHPDYQKWLQRSKRELTVTEKKELYHRQLTMYIAMGYPPYGNNHNLKDIKFQTTAGAIQSSLHEDYGYPLPPSHPNYQPPRGPSFPPSNYPQQQLPTSLANQGMVDPQLLMMLMNQQQSQQQSIPSTSSLESLPLPVSEEEQLKSIMAEESLDVRGKDDEESLKKKKKRRRRSRSVSSQSSSSQSSSEEELPPPPKKHRPPKGGPARQHKVSKILPRKSQW